MRITFIIMHLMYVFFRRQKMKKSILSIFILMITVTSFLAAGGQQATGRDTAASSVEEGQLLPIGAVDPASYLQDFEFEKTNRTRSPLLFEADLLKDSIWEKGETDCVRISLVSNSESFFKNVPGEFILYFQNPELLKDMKIINLLHTELLKNEHIDFLFFDPVNEALLPASRTGEISTAIGRLSSHRKQYDNNVQLQRLLSTIESDVDAERVHVLWISDENIVEKPADANFFNFAVDVLGSGSITFSYLGYGEVPVWTTINASLRRHNGNSYFAEDPDEICENFSRDIKYFSKPAIENIDIRIVWSLLVTELANYYPPEYYPQIIGFYPTTNNGRPRVQHYVGGMNYSEDKRFLHYVNVPPLQTLIDSSENRHPEPDGEYKIATVYLKYTVPMYKRDYYQQQDLIISYRNAEKSDNEVNEFVFCDLIIQNTPLILQEISNLVNRQRNYLAAIQLVNVQRKILQKVNEIRPDESVTEDIELLDNYYNLLFEQARTMNMLQ